MQPSVNPHNFYYKVEVLVLGKAYALPDENTAS